MMQGGVHQHQRQHGFGNRRGANADAGIMPAVGLDQRRLAGKIDGRLVDTSFRIDTDVHLGIITDKDQ